jgi:hypothetical protein
VEHPQESMFERFMIGALSDAETASFVAHVSGCDPCAKKLEVEAQAELAIAEVHAAAKRPAPRRSLPRTGRPVLGAVAGSLALAAAVLLFVLGRPKTHEDDRVQTMTVSDQRPTQPIPLVVCPDGIDQEKCVEDAHRHGLFVSYPPWASAPPLGGGRSGQGPSGSPFSVQQM